MNNRINLLLWVSRLVLSFFFLWAAWSKIIHPAAFARDMMAYQFFPRSLVPWLSLWVPWLEALAALGLLVPPLFKGARLWITALMTSFILLLSLTWMRGLEISCGCFGGGHESVLQALFRDLLLLLPLSLLWLDKRPVKKALDQPSN